MGKPRGRTGRWRQRLVELPTVGWVVVSLDGDGNIAAARTLDTIKPREWRWGEAPARVPYVSKDDAPKYSDRVAGTRKRPMRSRASSAGMPEYMVKESVGWGEAALRMDNQIRNRRGVIGNVWEPTQFTRGSLLDEFGGEPYRQRGSSWHWKELF